MEPASLSFAVVGMFFTCRKGYDIFSDTVTAPSDARDAVRRVSIERGVLSGWGERFDIWQDKPQGQGGEKLRIHLMRDQTRSGVFEALCAISETFTDIKKLDRKYGVVFNYHAKGDRVSGLFLLVGSYGK